MNKLTLEWRRLFAASGPAPHDAAPDSVDLIDAAGQVRAMVLGLAGPADWQAVAMVWRGVQADFALPAPAIAVAGEAGYQLWFSLAEAEPAPRARAFLEALRLRYLGDIDPQRICLLPSPDTASAPPFRHAAQVPAALAPGGPWSAFVAADLAPMFSDETWLDMPANPEGQADLLSRLASIARADFARAMVQLAPVQPSTLHTETSPENQGSPSAPPTTMDPRRFLIDVMNDDGVELALRIEAAKALLASTRPDEGSPA